MGYIRVTGGTKLYGSVSVQGSKNAVLPILAATILNGGINVISNCPDLSDVDISLKILSHLGCDVKKQGHTVTVNSADIKSNYIPEDMMREMRSSIVFMGAIMAKKKSAVMTLPGGCDIGKRPIDLHLKAFEKLGIKVSEDDGYIYCEGKNASACNIKLDFPSVGATENIMLMSSAIRGTTVIENAAMEPEIVDLARYLEEIGVKVTGAGSSVIKIEGTDTFSDAVHSIIPDRIVACTYMAAVASAGGKVQIENVIPEHFRAFTDVLKCAGVRIDEGEKSVTAESDGTLKGVKGIVTAPYPAFPTDTQSIVMSLMSRSKGKSTICENIFEDRFRHAYELKKMGAKIDIDGKYAYIHGQKKLFGAKVNACDLRSGAALIVAALGADGTTEIGNVNYIDRGYEDIHKKLRLLGANIERVDSFEGKEHEKQR